jgi:hypothetical protein
MSAVKNATESAQPKAACVWLAFSRPSKRGSEKMSLPRKEAKPMIVQKGVDMNGVCKNLKAVLKIIHLVFYEEGNHLIIIATKWGRDEHRDAHEHGLAIDVKKPLKAGAKVLYRLKGALGVNFNIKKVASHLHIEYDPVPTLRNRKGDNL